MSDQYKGTVRFHPSAKAQGFPAPDCYKLCLFVKPLHGAVSAIIINEVTTLTGFVKHD